MLERQTKGNKRLPAGRTIQTRDEFLKDGENTKKNHPSKKDLYRRAAVISSNDCGDLAITKLSTKGRHKLEKYKNGKSTYNAYLCIEDDKGNRIKIDGIRFVENKSQRDLSPKQVRQIINDCLYNPKTSKKLRNENKRKLDKIKKSSS